MLHIWNIQDIEALAIQAELKQHWRAAAILWRRVNHQESADYCEDISCFLAINNLDKLPIHQHNLSKCRPKNPKNLVILQQ